MEIAEWKELLERKREYITCLHDARSSYVSRGLTHERVTCHGRQAVRRWFTALSAASNCLSLR